LEPFLAWRFDSESAGDFEGTFVCGRPAHASVHVDDGLLEGALRVSAVSCDAAFWLEVVLLV
jgi:hypothetical protein